ncbi:hypothetical protein EWM64_g7721 [Hericium alpestre]|uniref:Transcription factor CBF/NF-Y/archaeal histone domain-containing protein n=1 Tax=Hericium alpestre TaxID=135208 RepID=A0A4Y9ZNB8_9AGAM|nr:hypothetical protein EWM64_g7721 [Hericium alpestre]
MSDEENPPTSPTRGADIAMTEPEAQESEETGKGDGQGDGKGAKKAKKRKDPNAVKKIMPSVRKKGSSLIPRARVLKVLEADEELPIVAKDVIFLISVATEEFIMRLAEASQRIAAGEKRATVQQKDIALVVRKTDEFLFLEEIIDMPDPSEAPPKQKKKKKSDEDQDHADETPGAEGAVVVAEHNDGTMSGGPAEQESSDYES